MIGRNKKAPPRLQPRAAFRARRQTDGLGVVYHDRCGYLRTFGGKGAGREIDPLRRIGHELLALARAIGTNSNKSTARQSIQR